jgi:hypothetical protein
MLHRTQQLGIDPRQRLRIQPIIFLAALPDQPHLARVRHDHFMTQPAQQATDPGRMCPGFQRHPAVRHCAEDFLQTFRTRTGSLLRLYLASFIHYAVPTRAISQVQSDRQFLLRNIPALLPCRGATSFIVGLLFICSSSTSITWERTASRRDRPSHLICSRRCLLSSLRSHFQLLAASSSGTYTDANVSALWRKSLAT